MIGVFLVFLGFFWGFLGVFFLLVLMGFFFLTQARGHVGGSTVLPPSEERDIMRVGRIDVVALPALAFSPDDAPGIRIVLHAKGVQPAGAEATPVLQAVLCAGGVAQADPSSTHFPLLLIKGLRPLMVAIQQWLEVCRFLTFFARVFIYIYQLWVFGRRLSTVQCCHCRSRRLV
jgi:hypothetical protein